MTQSSDRPYMHGYGSASQHMATRQAEQFADFLLPYLNDSQKLLDVGCGPGTITVGLAYKLNSCKITNAQNDYLSSNKMLCIAGQLMNTSF